MASIQESFINLRNDLKTWITNNLRLKANKADLIAGDGTEFKFKVSNGKYGYQNSSNSFVPFDSVLDSNTAKYIDCNTSTSLSAGGGAGSASVTYTTPSSSKVYLVLALANMAEKFGTLTLELTIDDISTGTEIESTLISHRDTGDRSFFTNSKYAVVEGSKSITATATRSGDGDRAIGIRLVIFELNVSS